MTGVEVMALPQVALAVAESIEDAVGDVEQPGAKGEKQRPGRGQVKMHGAGEEPRPESGDGGRIQAQQMPPFCEIVETGPKLQFTATW